MNAQEMWEAYSQREHTEADYDAWAFGVDADELARLVYEGIKTATASAYPLYELEGEALPEAGQYSVILDSQENAVCVIRTERVFLVPFRDVDARQAWKEGEVDRSLSYWRKVHEPFFRSCLGDAGLLFSEDMNVVCEEFIRVYP